MAYKKSSVKRKGKTKKDFHTKQSFPKLKRLIQNIMLTLLTILICLIFFEIFLRLISDDYVIYTQNTDMLTYHPILGVSNKPLLNITYTNRLDIKYNIKTNSHGWRDDEFKINKTTPYRVLVFGDSYVYGVGVDQDMLFTEIIEKDYLNDVEVLNFGIMGAGIGQNLVYYDKYASELEHDLVVVAFYVGNDFIDNLWQPKKMPYYGLYNNTLKLKNFPPPEKNYTTKEYYPFPINIHVFLTKHIMSYNFVIQRTITLQPITKYLLSKTELGRKYFLNIDLIQIYWQNETERYKKAQVLTNAILKTFSQKVKKNKADFLVIIIPTREQVSDKHWKIFIANIEEEDLVVRHKSLIDIAEICSNNDIKYLNMYPNLVVSKKLPYFEIDQHLNENGHKIMAEVLAKEIDCMYFNCSNLS